MSKRKEILKQAGVYSLGSQMTQLITIVASILSRRFLGPAQTGIWSVLQIIVDYSKYSTMGIMHALSREIPYWVGKGKNDIAESIKNTAYTFVLTSSTLTAGGIVLFAFITKGRFSSEITNGLFFIAGVIFLQRVNNLMISLLRCYKAFTIETVQMIWSAIVNAVLVAFLTYFFKLYGFIWAVALSLTFNIVYVTLRYRFNFRLVWDRTQIHSLISFGFPLMIIGILMTVYRSIDRILIGKMLGLQALGFYSIAYMVCTYVGNFSNSIAIVLFPHFQEKFGRSDKPEDLKEYVRKTATVNAAAISMIIGCVWIASPYFVNMLLPKFAPGIEAVKILSVSMFFFVLAQPYSDFLITIKKHFMLFPILVLISFLTLFLNWFAITRNYGITGVAFATSIAAAFHFTLTYFAASRYTERIKLMIGRYLKLLTHVVYLGLSLLSTHYLLPHDYHSLKRTSFELILFLILCIPYMVVLDKQIRLSSILKEKFLKI